MRERTSTLLRPARGAPAANAASGGVRAAETSPRLGNAALQAALRTHAVQAKLRVADAGDAYECEADRIADRIAGPGAGHVARASATPSGVMRIASLPGAGGGRVPRGVEDAIGSLSGGAPLPAETQRAFAPQLGVDLSDVRVHAGGDAAAMAASIGARAFTVERHIVFGAGEYQPTTASGKHVLAHEVAHTVQQRGGSGALAPAPRAAQRIALSDLGSVARRLRDLARRVPGYELLTVILGRDPITNDVVERSPEVVIHAVLALVPDGDAIYREMQTSGQLQRTVAFINEQIARLDLTWAGIVQLLERAVDSLDVTDALSPSGAWQRIVGFFEPTFRRIRDVASTVLNRIVDWIKERVLGRLRDWASNQRGYRLLTFVLGKDPFTDEPVDRSARNFIRAVLELVPGGDEIFQNLERARVIERTQAWLREEIVTLDLTWEGIKALFRRLWDTFHVADLLHPLDLIARIWEIFSGPVGRIARFALAVGKKVLEFIFEGAMLLGGPIAQRIVALFRRIGDTFGVIVADPVAFIGHLVNAVKLGFRQFSQNILTHLRTGLIEWLTGSLAGGGIQLPTTWDLRGILSLVLSIIGLTYQNFRAKLVARIGERPVAIIEGVVDFLRILITQGLAAAWQRLLEHLGNLWDTVIGAIRGWAITRIVTAAITRLVTLFNPVGAIIQSILAIYNTVAFFIERINQILTLVEAVTESIANIAAGRIAAAANYVERAMARAIPVILGFLARFIGLGNIGEAVQGLVRPLSTRVDAAMERVADWVVNTGRRFLSAVTGGGGAGAQPAAAAQAASADPNAVTVTFAMLDKQHTLEAAPSGDGVRVRLASGQPEDLRAKVERIAAEWDASQDEDVRANAQLLKQRMRNDVEAKETELVRLYRAASAAEKRPLALDYITRMRDALNRIATDFGIDGELYEPLSANEPRYDGTDGYGRPTGAHVRLTLASLQPRPRDATTTSLPGDTLIDAPKEKSHLIAATFGGADSRENLSPTLVATNRQFTAFEGVIRRAVRPQRRGQLPAPGMIIQYDVAVRYDDKLSDFTTWLQNRWKDLPFKTGATGVPADAGERMFRLIAAGNIRGQDYVRAQLDVRPGERSDAFFRALDATRVRARYHFLARAFVNSATAAAGNPDLSGVSSPITGYPPPP